jgi:hypothetical protein
MIILAIAVMTLGSIAVLAMLQFEQTHPAPTHQEYMHNLLEVK